MLTKELGLEGPLAGGGSGTKSVLSDLVSELIAEGAVRGTAKGGSAASWVPAIHAETQQVWEVFIPFCLRLTLSPLSALLPLPLPRAPSKPSTSRTGGWATTRCASWASPMTEPTSPQVRDRKGGVARGGEGRNEGEGIPNDRAYLTSDDGQKGRGRGGTAEPYNLNFQSEPKLLP